MAIGPGPFKGRVLHPGGRRRLGLRAHRIGMEGFSRICKVFMELNMICLDLSHLGYHFSKIGYD